MSDKDSLEQEDIPSIPEDNEEDLNESQNGQMEEIKKGLDCSYANSLLSQIDDLLEEDEK